MHWYILVLGDRKVAFSSVRAASGVDVKLGGTRVAAALAALVDILLVGTHLCKIRQVERGMTFGAN